MSIIIQPPKHQTELLERAEAIAGMTIGEIAAQFQWRVPNDLKRKKGWQGQLIEAVLGANSGNLSQPDFVELGIELKTLPIDEQGRVLESTYVCVLNLQETLLLNWTDSPVCQKLSKVLWVPIAKSKDWAVTQYRVATPFLWSASQAELALLQQDWEEAMELVATGKVDQLNARKGQYLQVRPKAAHSRILTAATDSSGSAIQTLPRGFYLRPCFTQQLVYRHLKTA